MEGGRRPQLSPQMLMPKKIMNKAVWGIKGACQGMQDGLKYHPLRGIIIAQSDTERKNVQ